MHPETHTPHHRAGMTLIELLVALAICGILFIAVSMAIQSLFASDARSRQMDALAGLKYDIMKEMTQDVRFAEQIVIPSSHDHFMVKKPHELPIQYDVKYDDHVLTKDTKPLHSMDFEVTSFSVYDYNRSGLPSLRLEIGFRSRQFPTIQDVLTFVVTNRQTVFHKIP